MSKYIWKQLFLPAFAVIYLVTGSWSQAQTTWLGGSGNWNTDSNWSGGDVPNNCYVIDPPCPIYFDVLIDGADGVNSEVQVSNQIRIDSLTLDQDDVVRIGDNSFIQLDTDRGGFLHNDGEIILQPGGGLRYGGLSGGQNPLMLTGSGKITLTSAGERGVLRGASSGGGLRHLINVDSSIQGFGLFTGGGGQVTNQAGGLIVANVDSQSLELESMQDGMLNEGILRATGGGDLELTNVPCNNQNVIEALHDSTITLRIGGVVMGGTLRSVGTGSIEVLGGSVGDVTLQGTVNHYENVFPVFGNIDNQSNLYLIDGGQLRNNGATSFSGGGTVNLVSTSGTSQIDGSSGDFINVDNTIRGSGHITVGDFANEAAGLVDADVAGQTLLVNPGNTPYLNRGTFRASNGGDLELTAGPVDNMGGMIEALSGSTVTLKASTISGGTVRSVGSGSIEVEAAGTSFTDLSVDGTVNLPSGQLHLLGAIDNQADFNVFNNSRVVVNSTATVIGPGTINLLSANPVSQISGVGNLTICGGTVTGIGHVSVKSVFDGGTISPGNSIGTLEFRDPTTWVGATKLQIELGAATGTPGTDWDLIDVGGSHELVFEHPEIESGVVIELNTRDTQGEPGMLDGFDSTQEYIWLIAEASSIAGFEPGSFDVDTAAFSNKFDGEFSVTVGPAGGLQGLYLRYGTFALGDVNNDGLVSLLDVAPFVNAIYNAEFISEADINLDGQVNLLDVALFVAILSS